jgi:NADPH-dependent curcumin reductase CurA
MAARATAHVMVVYDHTDLAVEHRTRVGRLVRNGRVPLLEDRYDGLEQAPLAFSRLMSGANVGKVVVQVH